MKWQNLILVVMKRKRLHHQEVRVRWIKYKELNNQVGMWVKYVEIDGIYDDQTFKAKITDISSNQKLINKSMKLLVTSDGVLSKAMDLGLSKLDDANYSLIVKAYTHDYKTMTASTDVKYTNTKFSSKYLKSINDFDVNIKATKKIIAPNLKVTTNLDNKLKGIFKKVLKEKAEKYKKELKSLIAQNTKESIAKLTKDNAELAKLEKRLGSNITDVASAEKELKNIEKKAKNQVNDKIDAKKKELKAKLDAKKKEAKDKLEAKKKEEQKKAEKRQKKKQRSF